MTPDDGNLLDVVDELANALQIGFLLAGKLANGLRADVHDADVLYAAITRATVALRRLTPTNSGVE
jgi:hypothetical protein